MTRLRLGARGLAPRRIFCYANLMSTLYTHKDSNIHKTWLFLAFFFCFVVAIGWVFGQWMHSSVWFYGAIALAFVMNIGSYWFSDKIVLSMVSAERIEKRENSTELWNIVENLSITAGLPMPALYIVNDPSPNAFATGRNPEHSAIAVHTGLLRLLNRSELEGVLAHELSHVGNRDTLVTTIAISLAGAIGIIADMMMHSAIFGGHGDDRDRSPLVMVLGVVVMLLAPLFATMLQMAVSRKREYLADASGALLTRYPEGLASALEKISAGNMHVESTTAREAASSLYIANPFSGGQTMHFIAKLFSTHPPVEDRIRILRDMR